jgi:membrane protease subunit HflK
VAEATGQGQRFDSVLAAYRAAKDVTLQRMYLDTMADVLTHSHPLVVDDRLKSIVPYLQLSPPPPPNAAPKPAPSPAPSAAPAESTVSSSGTSR